MEQKRNAQAVRMAASHYWQQIKADWKNVLPAFLFPALGNILVFYLPPLIVAKILLRFSNSSHTDLASFIPYILLFIVLWGSGEMLWRLGIHFLIKAESRGSRQLSENAMTSLLKKDLAFFHNNFSGSLTKRVSNYSWKYIDLLDTLAFSICSAYLPIIFVVYILWGFTPWLVFALVGLMIVTGFIIAPLIRKRQKIVAEREAAGTKVSGYIADVFSNIDTIKAFSNEDYELENHRSNLRDFYSKAKHSWDYQNLKIDTLTSPLYVLTNAVGLIIAIYVAGKSKISLQVLFVSFNYFAGVTRSMWEFNHVYRNIESALTEGAQYTELMLEEAYVKDVPNPKPFKVTAGNIDFDSIDFRYRDSSTKNIFNSFNLHIHGGEKVALVGHSGSGKTTITKLLLRFVDVTKGAIHIDGQNIAEVKQHDLRQEIAYVPQEPIMFHRSLLDNIRYGRLDATEAEVKLAAKKANAAEFIEQLPEGYDTLVGERGIKLSGGQRQRIAIARAILRDAPILILDEATSALDSESEALIQDALWKLMEGRTAIVIAHRLSTIQKMDRILVLDKGVIVEQGSHRELLSKKGVYAKLWAHQSGGFIE